MDAQETQAMEMDVMDKLAERFRAATGEINLAMTEGEEGENQVDMVTGLEILAVHLVI